MTFLRSVTWYFTQWFCSESVLQYFECIVFSEFLKNCIYFIDVCPSIIGCATDCCSVSLINVDVLKREGVNSVRITENWRKINTVFPLISNWPQISGTLSPASLRTQIKINADVSL